MAARPDSFSRRLLAWYDRHGRQDLPWQHPRDAYRVWVSEIMLQQTQVATVIPYFQRFMTRFPDVQALAGASQDEVLRHWAGLGYYARARNLHRAAQLILERHAGRFPQDIESVQALPGIGRSTAAAILAQAFGQRHAILDGNVKRLLSRFHALPGWPGDARVASRLWQYAEMHTPGKRLADYTQAVMDLGATVCARRPNCGQCPVSADCVAHQQGREQAFPQPRARKAKPLRATRLLVVERRDGSILLERRPSSGIWGGLWCLPELPEKASTTRHCRQALGLTVGRPEQLQVLRHGFTHYDLDIQPLRLRVKGRVPAAQQDGRLWYQHAGGGKMHNTVALPAPVQKLLDQIKTQESLT